MHSGYGEQQQQLFMVDGCPPNSFFSLSPPPATTSSIQSQQKFYHLPTHQPQQQQHHQPLPPPPQFSHLIHPVPITQQLFHPHPFHLFHHHSQLGMDNSSSPAPAPGPSSFLDSLMSFKLGVDVDASTAAAAGSGDHVLNEDDDVHVLHGDDGSDGSRLHSWRREEQEEEEAAATIKQPFWRPLDIDYINRNNKRPKSPENTTSGANYSKKSREAAVFLDPNQANTATAVADSNYKLFSELEAIYKPGSNDGGTPKNNQAGSGSCSALTGDDNHPIHVPGPAICPVAVNNDQFYHGSDTSDGGDAMPPPSSTNKSQKASSRRKQRAKRRQQEQAAAITAFFESLMKQVMDHQESLHCKFLHVMEKKDQERASREEASRKEEAARSAREAASRAQERALAASREAAIVSFLEKITGESLELPVEPHKGDQECNAMELYNADCGNNNSTSAAAVQLSNNRWPKAEVQALICVRSGLEPRFQEPGLKAPLWEEVSSTMETMGYRRSAKRCKEKWENINKYFRKAKDSGRKRSQRSKTCPYFQQLDQLYSMSGSAPPSSSISGVKNEESSKDINNNHNNNNNNSELLDAIVLVSNDHQSFKFPEMGSDQVNEVGSSAMSAGKGRGNCGDEDDNEDRRDAEEGEGDGAQPEQGHEHQLHFREGGEDLQLHDSTFYFQRLRC